MLEPAYETRGIPALSRTVASRFDPSQPAPLGEFLPGERVRRIVLLVVDGLGWDQLAWAAEAGVVPTLRSLGDQGGLVELRSTVPSTTAAALLSLSTGRTPLEHGYLGYRLYLEEGDVIADMLTTTVAGEGTPLDRLGLEGEALGGGPTLLDGARNHGWEAFAVTRRRFLPTAFTRTLYRGGRLVGYTNLGEMARTVRRLGQRPGPGLVLAYWDGVDHACHRQGRTSDAFARAMGALDRAVAEEWTSTGLSDTLLLVTSDHGHIDCPPERIVELTEVPAVADELARPAVGEARLPYLFAREGRSHHLLDALEDALEYAATPLPAPEAVDRGFFGPPTARAWARRLGDVVLIPKEDYCFTHAALPGPEGFVGRHGGLSPQEMRIPLLWTVLSPSGR